MKITYDKSVDAAYIYLVNDVSKYVHGFTHQCEDSRINGFLNLDFSSEGILLGIEIIPASKMLSDVSSPTND